MSKVTKHFIKPLYDKHTLVRIILVIIWYIIVIGVKRPGYGHFAPCMGQDAHFE
jgi:hypothetical protein